MKALTVISDALEFEASIRTDAQDRQIKQSTKESIASGIRRTVGLGYLLPVPACSPFETGSQKQWIFPFLGAQPSVSRGFLGDTSKTQHREEVKSSPNLGPGINSVQRAPATWRLWQEGRVEPSAVHRLADTEVMSREARMMLAGCVGARKRSKD